MQNYKKEFKSYAFNNKNKAAFATIRINPSELYTNSANIIWVDENKEIIYKGILYDVVSVKGKGLSVELTLVSDDQEMKLKADFAKMYDVDSRKTTKFPFELLKHFLALKYIVHVTDLNLNNSVIDRNVFFASPVFFITNRVIAQDAPPPDFFV
ncbi:MAG: hypothetical protein V4677_11195 [Bacteroidota bacterium]